MATVQLMPKIHSRATRSSGRIQMATVMATIPMRSRRIPSSGWMRTATALATTPLLGTLQLIKSINSGGTASGTFVADANFTGGSALTKTSTVTGVPSGVPAGIFNTERNGAFTYTFTALDTTAYHRVQLYFVETGFTAAAQRKFDVTFNGKLVLDDFDIFAAAGGASKVTSKAYVLKPDASGKIARFSSPR